jgi:hypothetical protein
VEIQTGISRDVMRQGHSSTRSRQPGSTSVQGASADSSPTTAGTCKSEAHSPVWLRSSRCAVLLLVTASCGACPSDPQLIAS